MRSRALLSLRTPLSLRALLSLRTLLRLRTLRTLPALLSVALLSTGLFSAPASSRPPEKMDLPDWRRTPVADRDLGHGIHMLESFGGNIGVVSGNEGVLLIDAEWPELHDKVLAAIRRISNQPIRYVVNTHWHWDHVGGDGLFSRAGATVFASPQTRKYIIDAQSAHAPAGTPYAVDPAAIPVITIDGKLQFHIGGQTVEVMRVQPAHTDGDLIVRYIEADIIQTGDTFFHGFYPDIDQPHGGTLDGMIDFYDTLYKMCGPATRIIPGHGAIARREDVREYQELLREIRSRVAKALDAGKTEEQLIAAHPLDDLDRKWGGNVIKQPYLLAIIYEELQDKRKAMGTRRERESDRRP